ncbi:cullin family protein [Teladorsagia circumcincta]|uniref:Cullin-5 n=1 Tax=Teladorsagia circumcincta TaxID=45464 RepID=A0A2G9UIW3_TELCI|nr:cullin family protein [Teladorsagia circumcincta]
MASMLRGAESEIPLNFDDEWAKIHKIVLALITQERVTQLEWQDLFLAVYKIHSWVDDGKKKLHAAIDYNVKEYVRMAREAIDPETAPPAPLPPGSESRAPRQYRSKTVREEMLETWKKVVFQHISLKLLSAALRLVEAERNGEAVDAHLVIGVRESWVALYDQRDCYYEDVLEQYRKHFEREFVEETVAYYKKRAAQYLAENGVINYMSYADRMLEEEEQRARKYLNPNPESVARAFRALVNDTTIFRMELPLGKKSRNTAVESKCPELLANYCDLLLRKTQLNLINIKILNGGAWGRGGVGAERSLVAYPKMKYQLLLCDAPTPLNPRDFTDSTLFYINHDFRLIKNGKEQHRGRINLIGRLQLSMESSATKEHEDIVALRELRVQEAAVKIMKMRKTITSAQLQTELVEMLKPMFIPNRKLIKEQIDWLIDNRFIERKDDDINTFVYVS